MCSVGKIHQISRDEIAYRGAVNRPHVQVLHPSCLGTVEFTEVLRSKTQILPSAETIR